MIKFINLRTIGIAVVVLLILYAFGVTQYAINQKDKRIAAEEEREQAIRVALDEKEVTHFYINQFRQQVSKTKSMEISRDNAVRLSNAKELNFLKQFDGLKKKYQNLESAQAFDLTLFGDSIPVFKVMVPCPDGKEVTAFRYELHDEFNDISALVLDTPTFKIKVPLFTAVEWQRKKFLFMRIGKKEYFIESYSPNKLIKIEGQSLYRVGKKK